jgi:hypothetical protein
LLILVVDTSLGPLITLIIFNPKKKSLEFDLAVIAMLQLCALIYGVHTVFIARPALIVFNVDRFDVVSAIDVDEKSLSKAVKSGRPNLSWWGPKIVAAMLPTESEERKKILFSSIQGGADLPQLPEYHFPYEEAKLDVIAKALPISRLKNFNKISGHEWSKIITPLGKSELELGYLPLRAHFKDGAVIVDKSNGKVLSIVLLNPW